MSPDYRSEGTTAEQLERAAKVVAVASNAANIGRLVVGALVTALGIVAATAVWASQRPTRQYVDEGDRMVASADMAVHKDQGAQLKAIFEQLARIETAQRMHDEAQRESTQVTREEIQYLRNHVVTGIGR